MNLSLILEDLLTELSGEEIYKKYYSKMPYEIFINLISADPQTVVDEESSKIQKMGKYSKLIVGLYQRGGLQIEDLEKANEYLGYVYKHKISLDLNKIKQLGDLYNIVKEYIAKDAKTFDEVLKVLPQDEYQLLFSGKKWSIYKPLTERASCYLGVGTEWCTTWGPYSLNKKHRDRSNYYKRYADSGTLYIIINKENTNEKYQFHFEQNQYMDKMDRKINTSDFLNEPDKKEILYFFFPSLYKKVGKEQLKTEFKRLDILPSEIAMKVFENSVGKINNKLVKSLMDQDEEMVKTLVSGFYEFGENTVKFVVDDTSTIIESLYRIIGYYEYEVNHGWQSVYDDVSGKDWNEYEDENMKSFLKSYYKYDSDNIIKTFGIRSADEFVNIFYTDYINNEEFGIKEAYFTDIADLSYESYETNNENLVKNIKKDIYVDYYSSGKYFEVRVNTIKFVIFLLSKGISKIEDEDNLVSVIEDYIKYCGHDGEFERIYDYDLKFPKYNDGNYLTRKTNDYFENVLENSEEQINCIELRKKLNTIIDKYFNENYVYENDHIKVRLKNNSIDCKKGTVKIEYLNKDTEEKFGGWKQPDDVKVENLVSLLVNYKLFESYSRYKKLIK
jgi:hypothetical protein